MIVLNFVIIRRKIDKKKVIKFRERNINLTKRQKFSQEDI